MKVEYEKIEFRKYPILDSYIYGLVLYYDSSKYPDSLNDGLEMPNSDNLTFGSIGYDGVDFPYWSYGTKGRFYAFREIYDDDLITIPHIDNYLDLYLKAKDGTNGLLFGRCLYDMTATSDGLEAISIITFACAVDISTNTVTHYLQNSTDFTVYHEITKSAYPEIITLPIPGKSKGIYRPYSGTPVFYSAEVSNLYPLSLYPGGISKYQDNFTKFIGLTKKIRKKDKDDPNDGGGSSQGGGGGGDGNIGGDNNPDDDIPTVQATDSGLMTLYNPTIGDLQNLGRFLWSDQWSLDNFKKLFNDPFDTLLGLSVIPIKPNTSGSRNIMFGNLDSGVPAPVISSQWVTKDMGSVTLNEVWKGALDYAPSTGVSIYLPFIGMRQLNTNDVMGSTIHLIYKFDVLTGSCIAQLYVNHNAQGNKTDGFSWSTDQGLLYEFQGQCSVNIPLSSQDYTNTIRAAISGVAVAAGTAASVATGNPALGIAGLAVGMANTGIQANTPTVQRSGHLSGSASLLGYTQPFLVVERPHQCKPQRYYALRGIPSQVYVSKLADCTGFTQITDNNNIHASGAQDTELEEIEQLLASGVYFPDKARS